MASKGESMARYQLFTEWWVGTSPDSVWEAIADYEDWPEWWPGIRSVELLHGGDEKGIGAVLRQRWRSRLPFTLVFDLEMQNIERPRVLEGRASGDLVGKCAWTLEGDAGGTILRFSVDVSPGRWWMNLPVPMAGLVFRSNFGTVLGWGREGLAGRLGTPVEDRTAAARERLAEMERRTAER